MWRLSVLAAVLVAVLVPGVIAAQDFDPLRSLYIHGMPEDVAVEYANSIDTDEQLLALVPMLSSHAEVHIWPNVAKVLGVSGNPHVIDPLIEFIEGRRHGPEWSSAVYRGRLSGILALGRFVRHHGDTEAKARVMTYLSDSVYPKG